MRIGRWTIDLDTGGVRDGSIRRSLTPKSAAVLRYLVEHPNEVISPAKLHEEFWTGELTSDNAAQKAISEIRRVLGEDPRASVFIETLHKRGYRFNAPTLPTSQDSDSAPEANLDESKPLISLPAQTPRSRSSRLVWIGFGVVAGLCLFAYFLFSGIQESASESPMAIVVMPFERLQKRSLKQFG